MRNLKQSRKTLTGILFLLITSIPTSGWCSKIVYPWRSTTAIVKTGETFEVWFNADSGQIVLVTFFS